jgi:hypothetical protein
MTAPTLGRLQRVELRAAWKHESIDFTPWLAREENIALLGLTIGLELEVHGQEQSVGPFKADILCRNTEDNSLVLIENQLAKTDHTHLGQLLTYAAGLKAVTLVWVAERFTEEHRAALDWINEITHEDFHFFGLEIELWRIGDSPLAPKFNVVVQPNEWARTVHENSKGPSGSTPGGQMQLAYWTSFGAFLTQAKAPFKSPKPAASNWMPWGLGRGGVQLQAFVTAERVAVGVEIKTADHPTWYQKLQADKAAIEQELGFPMDWEEKPDNKFSSIRVRLPLDMHNQGNWPKAHQWMLDRMKAIKSAFHSRVKALDEAALGQAAQ